jgi:hypothetical protein
MALGRPESAIQAAVAASRLADNDSDPLIRARCAQTLGTVLVSRGLRESALDAFFDARRAWLNASRQPPFGLENNIALMLGELGFQKRSRWLADDCVRSAHLAGRPSDEATALVTRGWAAHRMGFR